VWSVIVIAVDPCSEFESCVLDGFEAMTPCELFLKGFNKSFAEAVLLWCVRSDVFLFKTVVVDYGAVLA